MAETELSDVNETLSEATVQNQSIAAAKRKMESEMQTLHADFDEMSSEAKICEDKAAKAMVDAARLADELRCEQDSAMMNEKQKPRPTCWRPRPRRCRTGWTRPRPRPRRCRTGWTR